MGGAAIICREAPLEMKKRFSVYLRAEKVIKEVEVHKVVIKPESFDFSVRMVDTNALRNLSSSDILEPHNFLSDYIASISAVEKTAHSNPTITKPAANSPAFIDLTVPFNIIPAPRPAPQRGMEIECVEINASQFPFGSLKYDRPRDIINYTYDEETQQHYLRVRWEDKTKDPTWYSYNKVAQFYPELVAKYLKSLFSQRFLRDTLALARNSKNNDC
eukprot:TRINITY_DN3472_c0_g1_i1.p1 TRINITY_DN3472_c0_g1~~TRINITY_DN3472_c0_g1_i1.p1  ORF type:complete len:217 (+),score=23.35 TRINITY_DN3472_c0_g1_i1:99-749(+)